MRPLCPLCRRELFPVLQEPGSVINEDQFDAVRAGDYYCTSCPTNGRGNTGYRYFWKGELAPSASNAVRKYRKKPVVVEAMQWDGTIGGSSPICAWAGNQVEYVGILSPRLLIKTKEGTMEANVGDYIIKGVKGEFYPCKPDIFKATYDEA